MSRVLSYTMIEECPAFATQRTKRGQCQYPFAALDCAGKGFDVHNRVLSTVRTAMNRWMEDHEGTEFSVRQIDDKTVRVRRDK